MISVLDHPLHWLTVISRSGAVAAAAADVVVEIQEKQDGPWWSHIPEV